MIATKFTNGNSYALVQEAYGVDGYIDINSYRWVYVLDGCGLHVEHRSFKISEPEVPFIWSTWDCGIQSWEEDRKEAKLMILRWLEIEK